MGPCDPRAPFCPSASCGFTSFPPIAHGMFAAKARGMKDLGGMLVMGATAMRREVDVDALKNCLTTMRAALASLEARGGADPRIELARAALASMRAIVDSSGDGGGGTIEHVDAGTLLRAVCWRVEAEAAAKRVRVSVGATCGDVRTRVRSLEDALVQLVRETVAAAEPGASLVLAARRMPDGFLAFGVRRGPVSSTSLKAVRLSG